MASKLTASENMTKETAKQLFEESLSQLQKLAESLEESSWQYEDIPTNPDRIQKSAGL